MSIPNTIIEKITEHAFYQRLANALKHPADAMDVKRYSGKAEKIAAELAGNTDGIAAKVIADARYDGKSRADVLLQDRATGAIVAGM